MSPFVQPALIPEGRFASRLPTLPGCVRGIVGCVIDERGKKIYTLQCENCLDLETPTFLILMTFKFHPRTPDNNPRLCKPCRIQANPGCTCSGCKEDRTGSEY